MSRHPERTIAVVQARMGSTRLPGKVLKPLPGGHTVISLLLWRLSRCQDITRVVLATTASPEDDALVHHAEALGIPVYRGSETDVLDRYYRAAAAYAPDVVVRITGDCPFVDPAEVTRVIVQLRATGADYASNTMPPSFPDGLDVEAFTFNALECAWREAKLPSDREHVTPYLRTNGKFKRTNVQNETDESRGRWTIDEPADLQVAGAVLRELNGRADFGWREVLSIQQRMPEIFAANSTLKRNEGSEMGIGQKLWKRAKQVIPGGNMLLSKRAEMFLPEKWPAYFSRARGCTVWDLEGKEFLDMCIMGIGTNTLGYGHPEVDAAVREVINKGNMSTLNCPEEVQLAERLVELHPWAEMGRLARTGGEANAVAVRIARAAAGRDEVAFCGYHGWHDWYLAANLANGGNLAGHLLPGLQPRGVPQELAGTVHPFPYNDFGALEKIVQEHPVGVIIMEVMRNFGPDDGFLQNVRALATRKGIVLLFDECTSGFRQTFGGLHKQFGVEPDMAMFGKALGNGYAITAVIGRRAIMESAQDTFISSTFWTERIGPTAALKTLEVMERIRSWDVITAIGAEITARWRALADEHGLALVTSGIPAITSFSFVGPNALAYKTLVTQEMLKKGVLASNLVFACIAHTPDVLDQYFERLGPIFRLIRECEDGRSVQTLLEGPVCQSGFKRLN